MVLLDGRFDPSKLHETLASLARPRRTGSAGADAVEGELIARFEALGFELQSLPFAFSTVPGRFGLPAAGLAMAAGGVAGALLIRAGLPALALGALAAGLGLALAPLVFLPGLLRRLRWGRVETRNLLFTRDRPHWLVMAHRDTKSQRAPTLVRSGALVLALGSWLVLAGLGLMAVATGGVDGAVVAGGAVGTLGAAVLALLVSPAGNRSPGALDNATGLAAALAIAEDAPPTVGFLITDGEELGLAGAHAAVAQLPRVAGIINLDGLDDRGPIRVAQARRGRGRSASGAVAAALERDGAALGLEVVRRPLPPFVLLDHEPLAAAGRPALTVLKGTWRSLLRVHSPADSPGRLTGEGAAAVAALVTATLGGLSETSDDTLRPPDGSGHSPRL